jgi:hypothetical protein
MSYEIIGYWVRLEALSGFTAQRFMIESPAPSTTISLSMKNSIIFISALSLVAMMLASCGSVLAPDETATTGVGRYSDTPPGRSEGSSNSMSGGAY